MYVNKKRFKSQIPLVLSIFKLLTTKSANMHRDLKCPYSFALLSNYKKKTIFIIHDIFLLVIVILIDIQIPSIFFLLRYTCLIHLWFSNLNLLITKLKRLFIFKIERTFFYVQIIFKKSSSSIIIHKEIKIKYNRDFLFIMNI